MNAEDVWRLVEQARAELGDEADDDADAIAKRMAQLLARREPGAGRDRRVLVASVG